MATRRRPLINLLGFEIRFDLTWLILVALIVWTLGAGYFPVVLADLSTGTYIWMAMFGAFGLFASIILHELSHSVVGRRLGMRIKGIRLFVFGGAAEMTEEPPTPRIEALMVIAGPAMSVALAILCFAAATLLAGFNTPQPVAIVLGYLAMANAILAAFNMVPAYPLDGGRLLRAALWAWRGDLIWATRVASLIGGAFGLVLIVLGIVSALYGNLIGGMWWFLIGLFVRAAASSSYRQVLAQRILADVSVRRLMRPDPVRVTPDISVQQLTEDILLAHSLKEVPVVRGDDLTGVVGVADVKAMAASERSNRLVGDIMRPAGDRTIAIDARADEALAQMQRTTGGRLFVVTDGRLVGVLSLRDLLQHLSIRSDLQSDMKDVPSRHSFRGPADASAA
ncbi:site-2 protease family protein [Dongia deserti]|uniref:site-2 protease family protein n=1 Tax=Dongia deserti TaxID=2268030 RepID=UPI000E6482A0|nr:site-2 protease family protein [Dongia deserti]